MTAIDADPVESVRAVPWLAPLGPEALRRFQSVVRPVRFAPGATILAELEVGDELYVLTSGTARVTVLAGKGERREIATLGAGDACGEISVLTQDLRSATVTAATEVRALRLERPQFERLIASYPSIAVHFARVLATRLADADAALDELIDPPQPSQAGDPQSAIDRLAGRASAVVPERATLRRAWRELVVSRRREMPFVALASFLAVLLAVRLGVGALCLRGDGLFGFLRGAYTAGIALVFLSTAASLVRFRVGVQRVLAATFGAGFALILNELSVFLAFDTFYLNMTTRDPRMAFDVVALYRRSESEWAIALMGSLLVLLTYLRHFLRRSAFVLLAKVRSPKTSAP